MTKEVIPEIIISAPKEAVHDSSVVDHVVDNRVIQPGIYSMVTLYDAPIESLAEHQAAA